MIGRMLLAVALCGALVAPAADARPKRVYIAMGDSVTMSVQSKGGSFAPRLYRYLQKRSHGGANRFTTLGAFTTPAALRPGDGLDQAIRLIRARSNVVAMTLTIGGDEAIEGACWTGPACPYPANLETILRRLDAKLKRDPGRERLELLAYYNPSVGTGGEAVADQVLLGSDLRIDCAGTGPQVGLNDDIACIGWRNRWAVVDAWPTFKAGGHALMLDSWHANARGNELLAALFENACRLKAGAPDPDGFLAARPPNGGPGCAGVR